MRCVRCERKADVELRYSGHWLCKKHFTELFVRRVKKTIRHGRLLTKGDRVLVGLSGGKDSMTALKILNDIVSPIPHMELSAVSIDEGIRGKSLKKAKDYCKKIGVGHEVVSFKEHYGFDIDEVLPRFEEAKACSVCGVLKRRILNDHARKAGATKVATGHNLDDEIQAALMNYVRGDLDRLARLGPEVGVKQHKSFVRRIKPLRECPEDEVRAYADLMRLPYTRKKCPYSSDSLRTTYRKIIDQLEKNHPGSKYQMLRSTDELAGLMKKKQKGRGPGACILCGEPAAGKKCKTCTLLENFK